MKNNLRKLLLPLLFAVMGIVLGTIAVKSVQAYESRLDFEKTSGDFLSDTENTLKERETILKELDSFNDRIGTSVVYNLADMIDDSFLQPDPSQTYLLQLDFMKIAEDSGMQELFLTDADGRVLFAGDQSMCGRTLSDQALFGAENWQNLTKEDSGDERYAVTVSLDGTELRYYAIGLQDDNGKIGYYLIGGEKTDTENTIREYLKDLGIRFSNLTGYNEIAAFAVNADTGKVVYVSSELNGLSDKNISDILSEDAASLADGKVHRAKLNGTDRLFVIRKFESSSIGNWFIGTVSTGESASVQIFYQWTVLILFAMIFFAFIALQSGFGSGRRKMLRKFSVVMPAALIGTFLFLFYVYSMASASLAMEQMKVNADTFAGSYESNYGLASSVETYYKNRYVNILKSSAEFLEENGDLATGAESVTKSNVYLYRDENGNAETVKDAFGNPLQSASENFLLKFLAEEMELERIMIFNASGRTVSSSDSRWYSEIQNYEDGTKEELLSVLDRKAPYYYRIVENSGEGSQDELVSCFALPIRLYMKKTEDGSTVYIGRTEYEKRDDAGEKNLISENGLLYAESKTPELIYLSERAIAEDTMNNMRPAQNSGMALLETECGTYVCSTEGLTEKAVSEIGFEEADFGKDNYRFANLNGVRVFNGLIPTGKQSEYTLITVLPASDVFFGRIPVCLSGTAAVLIVLILMGVYFLKNETPEEAAEDQEKKIILPRNSKKYRNPAEYFRQMNSGERIVSFCRFIFLIIIFLLLIRTASDTDRNAGCLAFHYTIGKTWRREISLFSVSFAFYIIIITATVLTVLRKLSAYLIPVIGASAETVVRLILSLIEYLCVIVIIFYNLYLFGVQMGTVLTSAGIMTIVLGIGATSLIGDVLAGLFIIMEQEYKAGDIVTIDGFTGFVRSIGLRTTKVQDFSGNIKTFNNAKINGVLNLTDNYTTFFITFNISIDVPVEQIEDLVEKDLKKKLESNPDLVSGPWFSGIPEVKGNVYTVSIGASSLQQKSWSLRKEIIQEMLILLKEKGIHIS